MSLKRFLSPFVQTLRKPINILLENSRKAYIKSAKNPLVAKKIKILDKDQSIDYILANRINLARFGDGEFNLITKVNNLGFQKRDNNLSTKLYEVLNTEKDNLRLATCYSLINIDENCLESATFWYSYVKNFGQIISELLPNHIEYLDASLTRLYIPIMNQKKALERFDKLKKLWDKQDILFVEGEYSRNAVGNDLFENANSISRIICPSKNAFDNYEKILESIKKHGKDKLVIGCLGPTATVLAYDLVDTNIWFLDLGHIDLEYIWCLQDRGRTLIKGRLVNETTAKHQDLELDEKVLSDYKSSIIDVIK